MKTYSKITPEGARDLLFEECRARREVQEKLSRVFGLRGYREVITPEEFGFARCAREDLKGGTPAENAAITRAVLSGEQDHKRNAVLLNAGAALYIAGKADTMADGVALAGELIDSGAATRTLEKLIVVSNREVGAA